MPKQKLLIFIIVIIFLVLGQNISIVRADSDFGSLKNTASNVYQIIVDFFLIKKDNFLASLKGWARGRIGVSADIQAPEIKFRPEDYLDLHQDVERYIFPKLSGEDEKINIYPGTSEWQRQEEERIRAEEEARRKEEKKRKKAMIDTGSFCGSPGKYIEIDLSSQRLALCNNGTSDGIYAISSGSRYYSTPTGHFQVNSKTLRAYSSKYNLYMPYWMSFIGNSYGIHELPEYPNGYKEGTNYLGRAVSHGCIRLGVGPAARAYNWAPVGTPVFVHK